MASPGVSFHFLCPRLSGLFESRWYHYLSRPLFIWGIDFGFPLELDRYYVHLTIRRHDIEQCYFSSLNEVFLTGQGLRTWRIFDRVHMLASVRLLFPSFLHCWSWCFHGYGTCKFCSSWQTDCSVIHTRGQSASP